MWNKRRPRLFFCFEMSRNGRRFGWLLPLPVLGMLADILDDAAAAAACLPLPEKSRLPLAWCRSGAGLLGGLLRDTMRGDGLELSVKVEHAGSRLRVGIV